MQGIEKLLRLCLQRRAPLYDRIIIELSGVAAAGASCVFLCVRACVCVRTCVRAYV